MVGGGFEYLEMDVLAFTNTYHLENILFSNQIGDYYCTTAWNTHEADTFNAVNSSIVKGRLQTFYQVALKKVKFHLSSIVLSPKSE